MLLIASLTRRVLRLERNNIISPLSSLKQTKYLTSPTVEHYKIIFCCVNSITSVKNEFYMKKPLLWIKQSFYISYTSAAVANFQGIAFLVSTVACSPGKIIIPFQFFYYVTLL